MSASASASVACVCASARRTPGSWILCGKRPSVCSVALGMCDIVSPPFSPTPFCFRSWGEHLSALSHSFAALATFSRCRHTSRAFLPSPAPYSFVLGFIETAAARSRPPCKICVVGDTSKCARTDRGAWRVFDLSHAHTRALAPSGGYRGRRSTCPDVGLWCWSMIGGGGGVKVISKA